MNGLLWLLIWSALAKGPRAGRDAEPPAQDAAEALPEPAADAAAEPDALVEAPEAAPAAALPASPDTPSAVAPVAAAGAVDAAATTSKTGQAASADLGSPTATPAAATTDAPETAPEPPVVATTPWGDLVPPQLPSPPEALLDALGAAREPPDAPGASPPQAPPVVADETSAPVDAGPVAPPGSVSRGWLPHLPRVGAVTAWAWLALVTLLWTLLRGVRADAARLPEDAPAAQVGRLLGRLARLVTAIIVLALLHAVLPESLTPIIPWALVGGALALGWSLLELLRDVVAGAALAGERGLHPGAWAEGPGFAGSVIRRGLRATSLRTSDGGRVVVPHRLMAASTVSTRPAGGPPCRVVLRLGADVAPGRVRRAVRRAVAGSPWAAVADGLRIAAMPDQDGRWVIDVPLLSQGYAADVLATLPERVLQEIAADRDA